MKILCAVILLLTTYNCKQKPDIKVSDHKSQEPKNIESQHKENNMNEKFTPVTFESEDGLTVSANLYEIDKTLPVIVLCHQAGFNKLEYSTIAPELNKLGFNCLAIDQRSGGKMNDLDGKTFENETANRAKTQNLATNYKDAEPDIQAAIDYASYLYTGKLLLWGSSYSSTHALYIAAENEKVDAAISFSPGDYWETSKGKLVNLIPKINKPFFITSSKREANGINNILSNTTLTKDQVHFTPQSDGFHGSKALWPNQPGGNEYWAAITDFIKSVK